MTDGLIVAALAPTTTTRSVLILCDGRVLELRIDAVLLHRAWAEATHWVSRAVSDGIVPSWAEEKTIAAVADFLTAELPLSIKPTKAVLR